MADSKQDRLFVRDGRRTYRRRYSRTEVRWGAVVLLVLAALGTWIAWKGRHPDPSMQAPGPEALTAAEAGTPRTVLDGRAPSGADRVSPSASEGAGQADAGAGAGAPASDRTPAGAGRAPFPAGIASAGWVEGPVAHYDNTNLYVKIDGREDYYKSFGFQALHWVSLASQADPAVTVDIELFDMGGPANALGAYAGERAPEAAPQLDASGMWHRARNATFATVGNYYLRLLGADESDAVQSQVEHARKTIVAALPAAPLPWGYTLFAGILKLDPGKVSFTPENAYSLGFARNVYAAPLGDGDLEGFVTLAADPAAATALAAQFVKGFLDYGEDGGTSQGAHWVHDRYVKTFGTAIASGTWVVGVRGGATVARGKVGLARVENAVRGLDAATVQRARTEAAAATTAPKSAPAAEPSSAEPAGEPAGEPKH